VKFHPNCFVITDTTIIAALSPAIGGELFAQGSLIFLPKITLVYTAIQMRPGKNLIKISRPLPAPQGINSCRRKSLLPEINPQLVTPAVETTT
jgi:hypothetical protein